MKHNSRLECFKEPYHNLLYAMLLQAAKDSNGYINSWHKLVSGSEAEEWLKTTGKEIYLYLEEYGRRCNDVDNIIY